MSFAAVLEAVEGYCDAALQIHGSNR